MNLIDFVNKYWNYYMQLENDFFSFEAYCSIDNDNDDCFSTRYLQLFLSICGEIDTICKTFCKKLDNSLNTNNCRITDYIKILNANYTTFAEEKIKLNNYKYLSFKPWENLKSDSSPDWWKEYNLVKHHRDELTDGKENYKLANQKNTIQALCALYILIEYWISDIFNHDPTYSNIIMPTLKSKKFTLENWDYFYPFFAGNTRFDKEKFLKYINGEQT